MLKLQLHSPVPIYEQIVLEIRRMIDQGTLKEGEPLPTIRSLASQLDIAVNTAARAYQELERLGLIESNGRKGSFVKVRKIVPEESYLTVFKDPVRRLLQKGMDEKEIKRIFKHNLSLFFD